MVELVAADDAYGRLYIICTVYIAFDFVKLVLSLLTSVPILSFIVII